LRVVSGDRRLERRPLHGSPRRHPASSNPAGAGPPSVPQPVGGGPVRRTSARCTGAVRTGISWDSGPRAVTLPALPRRISPYPAPKRRRRRGKQAASAAAVVGVGSSAATRVAVWQARCRIGAASAGAASEVGGLANSVSVASSAPRSVRQRHCVGVGGGFDDVGVSVSAASLAAGAVGRGGRVASVLARPPARRGVAARPTRHLPSAAGSSTWSRPRPGAAPPGARGGRAARPVLWQRGEAGSGSWACGGRGAPAAARGGRVERRSPAAPQPRSPVHRSPPSLSRSTLHGRL